MSAAYRQPRKLNFVSFLVGLALLAGAYAVVQFGPPYYRKWQVKSVLAETASRLAPKHIRPGEGFDEVVEQARQDAVKKIRQEGVEDGALQVSINKSETEVTVSADYTEVIEHPLVNRTTTLRFRPYYSRPVSR